MMGLILWKTAEAGRKQPVITVSEVCVLHVPFLQVEILRSPRTPERLLRRRVRAAGKKLRKREISKVVLPREFPFLEQLSSCGIQPVSTLPLRRALTADWVRWKAEEQKRSLASTRVAVVAQQLTGETVRTVTELALRHRYVLLDVPRGGEELCRQLRREYGVSLQLNPPSNVLEEAEVAVLLDRREDVLFPNSAVLRVDEEAVPLPPLALPPMLEEQLPDGVCRVLLAAALQSAGVLRRGQVGFLRESI